MIELPSTIADARELTSEAMCFGIAYGLFTINADGALEAKPKAVTFKTAYAKMSGWTWSAPHTVSEPGPVAFPTTPSSSL